jgi:ribonuclease P protein component
VLVPKRWARRAVTRNAIRRQIYATAPAAVALPVAAHVVRLRSGFDRSHFVSASSAALKHAVREELQQLWARALARGAHAATGHVA